MTCTGLATASTSCSFLSTRLTAYAQAATVHPQVHRRDLQSSWGGARLCQNAHQGDVHASCLHSAHTAGSVMERQEVPSIVIVSEPLCYVVRWRSPRHLADHPEAALSGSVQSLPPDKQRASVSKVTPSGLFSTPKGAGLASEQGNYSMNLLSIKELTQQPEGRSWTGHAVINYLLKNPVCLRDQLTSSWGGTSEDARLSRSTLCISRWIAAADSGLRR